MKTKILVVVDMQNDFVTGSLGTPEAVALVPKVVEKIMNFEGAVIYTQDTHGDDYLDTLEGKKLPVKHCIANTKGWEIVPEILKAEAARKWKACSLTKPTFGSFKLLELMNGGLKGINGEQIAIDDIEKIEVCGLCTDICVVSNALLLRAKFPNMKIVVDGNLTEGVTPATKAHAIETMKMCQIDVL